MRFYGWVRGEWREDKPSGPSKFCKVKSSKRQASRIIAKKAARHAAKVEIKKQLQDCA